MRDKEVNRFFRAAKQRLTSASILFDNDMYLDCMYLAGYTIECALKGLILANVPLRSRQRFLSQYYRGAVAHDFEYLKALLKRRRVSMPLTIARQLRDAAVWSTELRYEVGKRSPADAQAYLNSAKQILQWAERSA